MGTATRDVEAQCHGRSSTSGTGFGDGGARWPAGRPFSGVADPTGPRPVAVLRRDPCICFRWRRRSRFSSPLVARVVAEAAGAASRAKRFRQVVALRGWRVASVGLPVAKRSLAPSRSLGTWRMSRGFSRAAIGDARRARCCRGVCATGLPPAKPSAWGGGGRRLPGRGSSRER